VKRVGQALAMLGGVVAVGTIGYHTLEDMTILDALYMTVTTVSTVGFGEVHPLSHRGRAFTIGLILFGVSTMAWAAESTVEALLEDHIRHAWWMRHMERVIDRLSNLLHCLRIWTYGSTDWPRTDTAWVGLCSD
jgi:voltage-gated potassium channel